MKKAVDPSRITEGTILSGMFFFSVPIIFTGMLQLLYSVADNIIVGRFSSDPNALAAVGSTSALTNVILIILIDCANSGGVMVARFLGAKRFNDMSRLVHTAFTFALCGGVIIGALGCIFCRPMLALIGTRPEVIDASTLYLRIILLGAPASAVYNFGASVLRANGNSKTPLMILASTGLLNVLLNLFFVLVLDMTVDGVALATITAQYASATAVFFCLRRGRSECAISFKKMCIDKGYLASILAIGVPSGLQAALMSLSGVVIQSAMNTFEVDVISGSVIAGQIENLAYICMNSMYHSTVTYVGQNYGAGNAKRTNRVLLYGIFLVTVIGLITSFAELALGRQFSSLFTDSANSEAVISAAVERLWINLPTLFLLGIMEVQTGYLRALGYSAMPMISSFIGTCIFRFVWIALVFPIPLFNCPVGIYVTTPISSTLLCIFNLAFIIYVKKNNPILSGKTVTAKA